MLNKLTVALIAYGPWGLFLLGLLDSVGIPIPGGTDVLVIVLATKAPALGWPGAAMAVIGSLIGNAALYWMARRGGRRFAEHAPQPGKPHKFRLWYHRYGLMTVFIPAVVPLVPLPLKVFVISAGILRTGFGWFLSVIFVARVIRYFGLAYLGLRFGEEGAWTFLRTNRWTLAAVAAGFALVCYAISQIVARRHAKQL